MCQFIEHRYVCTHRRHEMVNCSDISASKQVQKPCNDSTQELRKHSEPCDKCPVEIGQPGGKRANVSSPKMLQRAANHKVIADLKAAAAAKRPEREETPPPPQQQAGNSIPTCVIPAARSNEERLSSATDESWESEESPRPSQAWSKAMRRVEVLDEDGEVEKEESIMVPISKEDENCGNPGAAAQKPARRRCWVQ